MNKLLYNGITLSRINSICYVAPGMGKIQHYNRPYHGFVYYYDADCAFHFDDISIAADAGSIIYLPQGRDYKVERIAEPKGCYAINFSCFEDLSENPFCIKLKNKSRAESLFKSSEKLWKLRSPEAVSRCNSAFYEILSLIQHEAFLHYVPDSKKKKIAAATEHIQSHFLEEDISIEHLASLCGMSSTYFRRLFSEIYGISPLKYINSLKIEHAKELLMSDMYPIEEIASVCGFSDGCYFRRVFKAQTDTTPTEYKRTNKQRAN